MSEQANGATQRSGPLTAQRRQRIRRLKRRGFWVAGLGLGFVVFATHWVWVVIAALLTLFLVFALDDEVKEIEREG